MKKITALLLAVIIIALTPMYSFAASEEETCAQKLYDLGLFRGVDTQNGKPVFALEDNLTREQAVVMLLRLLGKEQEALLCDFPCTFPDVAPWAEPYVGYAQVTGLTLGIGNGLFGGGYNVSGMQFLTFVLRALGYSTPIDFTWDKASEYADKAGLPGSRYASLEALTRGAAAVICEKALSLKTKENINLLKSIESAGKVNLTPKAYDVGTFSNQGGSTNTTGKVNINNSSSSAITSATALKTPSSLKVTGNGKVTVLIVHTHGSESYTPFDGLEYKATGTCRTTDTQRNMIRIGEIVADILNSRGIGTVHIQEMPDHPNYNNSYKRSRALIEQAMKEYPDIQMVIDIHRDSVSSNGKSYKTQVTVNGQSAAQLMIVSGTGGDSNWKENLGIQSRIHNFIENRYPGLMRPIILRDSSYNHDLSVGSMILEVGTAGNSLSEAMYSAYIFAGSLADYLLDE